jgi:hypothetical protein
VRESVSQSVSQSVGCLVSQSEDSWGSIFVKLVAKAEDRSPLKAAAKQLLGKTENFMCAVVTVIFGVCNSVRLS